MYHKYANPLENYHRDRYVSNTSQMKKAFLAIMYFAAGRISAFINEKALQDCEKKCQQNSTGFCLKP